MNDLDIPHRKFLNVRPTKNPIPRLEQDDHWTPQHHLKYLEKAGFTITEKMLQYVNNAESLLDEIKDWKWINHRMVEQGYTEGGDYGRF
jgi:NAD-dependent DNA ligase